MTNEFKGYHPIVNFIYFVFAISFTCLFLHPFTLFISLLSGGLYSVMLNGTKHIRKNFIYTISAFFLMALVNPAFNHRGVTVLAYLPSGNPFTLESVFYGFSSAAMILGVILFFSCFNRIMTSDKIIYLFGKIVPSLSLIFSMTLRFIPEFTRKIKETANSRKCVGKNVSGGKITERIKSGLSILSISVTWSFENAIDTSDSMKSRGYGLLKRTSFSIYSFSKRDIKVLSVILILAIYVIIGSISGHLSCYYFPAIRISRLSAYGLSVFTAYFLLLFLPIIIELSEVIKWKYIHSKM